MPFNFAIPKRLLYITEQGVSAYRWEKKTLIDEGHFAAGEAPQLAEFETYLQQHRRLPIFAVIDVIELDFRYEVVPHARGQEAAALRNRKLNATYRATPFRHVLNLGREDKGRKDDRLLLSALTNPEAVAPWLPAIARNKAPLAGLCATPLLLAETIKEWSYDHTLLVTLGQTGNIRLSYFYQGSLRFSRLAPHLPTNLAELPVPLTEEITRTQQYLINLRLMGRDDALHVDIITNGEDTAVWADKFASTRLLDFHEISVQALADRTRTPLNEHERSRLNIELLQLHLLARRFAPNHYAPRDYLHEAYLRLLRLVLHGTAIGGIIGGSMLVASSVMDLFERYQSINTAKEQAEILNRRYLSIKAEFPPAPAAAGAMKESVDTADAIEHLRRPHNELLGSIAHALEAAPAFRLEKLVWSYNDPAQSIPQNEATTLNQKLPTAAPAAPGAATEAPRWNIFLAAVTDTDIRPRTALHAVDAMLHRLQEDKSLTVKVLRYPYNVTPDAQLEGASGLNLTNGKPTLYLQIIWESPLTAPEHAEGVQP